MTSYELYSLVAGWAWNASPWEAAQTVPPAVTADDVAHEMRRQGYGDPDIYAVTTRVKPRVT